MTPDTPAPPSGGEHPYDFFNEPPLDFSQESGRAAIRKALADVRALMPFECPLIVDGKDVATPETIRSDNPSKHAETVGTSASATIDDADRAVAAARAAWPEWSETPAEDRADALERWAELMDRRRAELAAVMILEAGKPWREADADVCEAIDFLRYYAREMRRLDVPIRLQPSLLGEENDYGYAPLGVVVVIAPWNFPLAIPTGMVSAALAAGNTVVFKPAEQTPVIGWYMVKLAHEAGVPPGALHFLPGVGETIGPRLVAHPEVDMIVFTGSRAVGCSIIETAAKNPARRGVKRVVTEMGGKNAIIVDADGDLDVAIPDVLYSAFGFAGQKCSACSRVIVLESVAETFYRRLSKAAASVVVGPAEDPLTQVGPLIDKSSQERLLRFTEVADREGTLIYRGDVGRLASQGYFVAPSVHADLKLEGDVMTRELFGPLLGCVKAATLEEAFDLVNATEYALTGGIHSRTPSHIREARRRVAVGNFYINRGITGAIVGRQPFGGFRFSGVGSKAGGPDYLKQFLVARTWTENIVRQGFAPIAPVAATAAGATASAKR